MDLYSNLVEAEQRLVALVSSIEADSYSSPTPCDRWDVRALLSRTDQGFGERIVDQTARILGGQRTPDRDNGRGDADARRQIPVVVVGAGHQPTLV